WAFHVLQLGVRQVAAHLAERSRQATIRLDPPELGSQGGWLPAGYAGLIGHPPARAGRAASVPPSAPRGPAIAHPPQERLRWTGTRPRSGWPGWRSRSLEGDWKADRHPR